MQSLNRANFRVKVTFSRTLYSQSAASVSMGSLTAYLRSLGFETDLTLIDPKGLHAADAILGNSPDRNVVIAKPNFKDFEDMFCILERLKSSGSVTRVFLCGPFAKRNVSSIMLRLPWVDGVFMSQLELSAGTLLATMSNDLSSWKMSSPGSISRDPFTGTVGTHTPLLSSMPLSLLPYPARDVELGEDVGFVNIEASRGCEFACSFCHIPGDSEMPVGGSALNVRGPRLVVDEIEKLNREMGKTLFIFNDSCFWSTKKDDARILEFCEEIVKRKLDVRFYIYLKGEPFVGDEVLRALVKAGLVRVFLGVENSIKSSLEVFRKKIRSDLYETVRDKLGAMGVNVHIGYIAVEPYSSLEDVLSNVEYLFKVGKLFRLGTILEPVRVVPGRTLYRKLVSDGLMDADLPYDQVTYGYRFLHKETGELLRHWKALFGGPLKAVSYGFEYHSTTGELLRVLAERLDPEFKDILACRYEAFNAKKWEGMKLLLGYFRHTVAEARTGELESGTVRAQDAEFSTGFAEISADLAVLYGGIVSTVRQHGGGRAVREIYIG